MNMPTLTLDPEDIVMAMGDQFTDWMIDPATGKLCMERDEAALMIGDDAADSWSPTDPNRVLPLPDFDSSNGYRLMQQFALEHAGSDASRRLLEALDKRKPFRQFKDALCAFPEDRARWFEFEAEAMKRIAEDFYESEGYAVRWADPSAGST